MGISHKTAWRWYTAGTITGVKMSARTILIDVDDAPVVNSLEAEQGVYIYGRVSTSRDNENLERQIERVKAYCRGKGYQVAQSVSEIASGMNDKRPKLMSLVKNEQAKIIVVEHKDRLTRFGFNYLDEMLKMQGRRIEVVDLSENQQDDVMLDLVSIITSFCARQYGQRRGGKISKRTIQALQGEGEEE
jgi:predicted site-specific integrase-resolvase